MVENFSNLAKGTKISEKVAVMSMDGDLNETENAGMLE